MDWIQAPICKIQYPSSLFPYVSSITEWLYVLSPTIYYQPLSTIYLARPLARPLEPALVCGEPSTSTLYGVPYWLEATSSIPITRFLGFHLLIFSGHAWSVYQSATSSLTSFDLVNNYTMTEYLTFLPTTGRCNSGLWPNSEDTTKILYASTQSVTLELK